MHPDDAAGHHREEGGLWQATAGQVSYRWPGVVASLARCEAMSFPERQAMEAWDESKEARQEEGEQEEKIPALVKEGQEEV